LRGRQATIRLALKELRKGLERLYGPRLRELLVYGSFARGEAEEGSDLDVAMVLDDFQDHWDEIQRSGPLVSRLSHKHGITISLYRIRERDWQSGDSPILSNIRTEGLPF